VSRPRAPSFGAEQRSRIARRAATARWSRQGKGVLTLGQIRNAVAKALGDRKAKAFVFGSYARGDATARSDVDIMVIEESTPKDWLQENSDIRDGIHEALGGHDDSAYKEVDLVLVDEATFEKFKNEHGCAQHEAFREGVRLV
jgi:predicted nucleotidyltransferase